MTDLINKLQEILVNAKEISEEQAEEAYVKLEFFKSVWGDDSENQILKGMLLQLLSAAEEDPKAIVTFFEVNDKLIRAYIKGGSEAVLNVLETGKE